MIDLDRVLRLARAKVSAWTSESALYLAHVIGHGPDWTIDWDAGAGESWVRLIKDDRVIALVSIVLPLVIVEESVAPIEPQYGPALPVVVSDLGDPIFSASRRVLDDVFGQSDRFHLIDLTRFSANDLWYATV